MFWRQRSYAVSHQGGLFANLRRLIRRRILISQAIDVFLEFLPVVPCERGKRHGALHPDRIAVTVEEDRAEPGEKLAAAVVATQVFPRLHQRVLSQIFRQSRVATERDGLSQQPCFINPAHVAVGFSIARLGFTKRTARVGVFAFHKRWRQAEHTSIISERAGTAIRELPGPSALSFGDHLCGAWPAFFPLTRNGGPSFSTKISTSGNPRPAYADLSSNPRSTPSNKKR